MRFFALVAFLAVPATVSACEGDCIVGITNAWLGNYTKPIDAVMRNMAAQISDIMPGRPSEDATMKYLAPIMNAYNKNAYKGMETAIFPGYFHGKCLDANGFTPPGCPNPDCPIVCGTPGSLVHFYSKLRFIAFNQTYSFLESLADPSSSTYKQVEKMVVAASEKTNDERRRTYSRIFPRGADGVPVPVSATRKSKIKGPVAPAVAPVGAASYSPAAPAAPVAPVTAAAPPPNVVANSANAGSTPGGLPNAPAASGAGAIPGVPGVPGSDVFGGLLSATEGASGSSSPLSGAKKMLPIPKRSQDVKAGLKTIFAQIHALLEETCGGDGAEHTNGLPHCSWEQEMKEYILVFP